MGLFTPKWMTEDRNKQIVALNAVSKVTNENVLKRIALEAPLPDVRVAAVYQMKDPALLREIAFSDDKYVSRAAINNITEPNALKEIACENITDGDYCNYSDKGRYRKRRIGNNSKTDYIFGVLKYRGCSDILI